MKICGMKIVINPSLFIFISNQLKICRYSYIVVMPLNSYWIAAEQPLNCRWINFCYWILNISLNAEFSVEWIFVIEYWMFYWMLNFPRNTCWITVELIFITEHWTFRWMLNFPFNFNSFAYWIFCWTLKFKF